MSDYERCENMKIGICDDSVKFCEDLKAIVDTYCAETGFQADIIIYHSGDALLEDTLPCDILFLDIELGDVTGIEVLKMMEEKNMPTTVLVVTSFPQYIDEAMDYAILRYIQKPVEASRVFRALDSALERMDERYIVLRDIRTRSMHKVAFRDIVYAETKMRKVLVHTKTRTYVLREGFRDFKNKLKASFFAEPHYSYIVNMHYIKCFKRTEIIMDVGEEDKKINVSSDKQHSLRKKYYRFLGEE